MRALMWFRTDLRVRDNRALAEACREADRGVVGVFAVTPAQWKEHDWGAAKVDFVMRNVAELSAALEARNVPLLVLRGDTFETTPRALLRLARRHECDRLYANREYEVNERRRDRAVRRLFEEDGREVRLVHDQTILAPDAFRTGQGDFYTVFTPFRKKWLATWSDGKGEPPGGLPKRQPELPCPPDEVPVIQKGFPGEPHPDRWPAGEAHARRRLASFIEKRAGDYHEQRDRPSVNGTSTLSPYLAAGVISPRECFQAALDANRGRASGGRKGLEVWISELVWREFYRHILVGYPRVCRNRAFREETERLEWSQDEEAYGAWREGRTGYPIVDAAMRQLAQTGWMHNRLRMIVASFLAKDLFLDWRLGEKHFMRSLVDGDFASNNGGWQWAASTGTDAQPWFRVFNPTTQSKRYDPDGSFLLRFLPELEGLEGAALHDPPEDERKQRGYPEPLVEHGPARERAIRAFRALTSRT